MVDEILCNECAIYKVYMEYTMVRLICLLQFFFFFLLCLNLAVKERHREAARGNEGMFVIQEGRDLNVHTVKRVFGRKRGNHPTAGMMDCKRSPGDCGTLITRGSAWGRETLPSFPRSQGWEEN